MSILSTSLMLRHFHILCLPNYEILLITLTVYMWSIYYNIYVVQHIDKLKVYVILFFICALNVYPDFSCLIHIYFDDLRLSTMYLQCLIFTYFYVSWSKAFLHVFYNVSCLNIFMSYVSSVLTHIFVMSNVSRLMV